MRRNISMSDEALVAQIIAGDTPEYRQLVERYEMPLVRYVIYLIRDPDTAEDVVQETFIKAYQNLRGFNPKYKFSSWLYRIAHNAAIDALPRHPSVSFDDDPTLEKIVAIEPTIAEQIDAELAKSDLEECLGSLHVKYREPIILHFIQQKSYQEISDVLHISVSAVGVRVNRAKQKLRALCKTRGVQR